MFPVRATAHPALQNLPFRVTSQALRKANGSLLCLLLNCGSEFWKLEFAGNFLKILDS
jgi:hypothetical protein